MVSRLAIQEGLEKAKEQLLPALTAKSTYDSLNNIWIDEDHVNYISSGDYESYTFGIIDADTTKLKNLLFSKEVDSTFTSFLVTYDLNYISKQDIRMGNIPTDLTPYVTYEEITTHFEFKMDIRYTGSGDCVSSVTIMEASNCGGRLDHSPGEACLDGIIYSREAAIIVAMQPCAGSGGGAIGDGNSDLDFDYDTTGGGATGGNNNPPNTDCLNLSNDNCAGVITDPVVVDPVLLHPDTESFIASLTNSNLRDFINHPDQRNLLIDVNRFLTEENNSPEAEAFAIEAIIASEEGGEVDFENKSIYDETVPDCIKDIINKLKPEEYDVNVDLSSVDQALLNQLNVPQNIINLFDNDENYGIQFIVKPMVRNLNEPFINATTQTEVINFPTNSRMATITLNSEYVSRSTDLAIVRTVIHELIHAYIKYGQQTDPNSSIGQTMDEIIELTGTQGQSAEHELMARQFVDAMTTSLAAWDNNMLSSNVYEEMAWSGGMRLSEIYTDVLDPQFTNASEYRDSVESGFGNGTVLPLGNKTCI
jgi:hypothetical protein